ncbi:MAG: YdeI/OmpD-associated family protein [Chthoniobacterales bacterium]|nr:YdeI/OmpD-associated family protein [Chthoniobacterales bacterium]
MARSRADASSRVTEAGEAIFFATAAELRAWLAENHGKARELWVAFHRKRSGRLSVTWPESVDEALCVGWIDGVRKSIDADSYKIRFTPRKPASTWSAVNIARVAELTRLGRMQPGGLEAFARRREERSGTYAYENQNTAKLGAAEEERFRAKPEAWEFFAAQPPSYRRLASWWVISAKRAETRKTRLAMLIADSAARRRIGRFAAKKK